MKSMTMMFILTCLHATEDTPKNDGITEVMSENKESRYIFEKEQEAETLLSLLTSASVVTTQRSSLIENAVDSAFDFFSGQSPKFKTTKEQINYKRDPKWIRWIKMLAEESFERKKVNEAEDAIKMVEAFRDQRVSKVFLGFKEREVLSSVYSEDSKSAWNISKIQFNEVSYLIVAFSFKESPLGDVYSTLMFNEDLKVDVHKGMNEEFSTQNMAKNVSEKLFEIWNSLSNDKKLTTQIIFTGHSLGGGLAQIMGGYTKDEKAIKIHARLYDKNFKEALKRSKIKTFGSPQIFNLNTVKIKKVEKFWNPSMSWRKYFGGGENPSTWTKVFEQDSVHFMNHDDIVPYFLQNVPYQGEVQGIVKTWDMLKTLAEHAQKANFFKTAQENNYEQWRKIVKISVKSAVDPNSLPNAAELMELLMIDKSIQDCVQEYTKTEFLSNNKLKLFWHCKGAFRKNPMLFYTLANIGVPLYKEMKTVNYTAMGRRYVFTNDSLKKVDEEQIKKDSLSNLKDAVQNLFEGTGINAYMKNFLSLVRPEQEKSLKTNEIQPQKMTCASTISEPPKEESHRNPTISEPPKEEIQENPTIEETSNSSSFRLAFSITLFCLFL